MLRLQGAKRLTRSFRNLQIARDPEQPSVAIWGLEKTNVDSNYLKVLSHAIKNAKTDESIKAIVIRNEDPDTFCLGSDPTERKNLSEKELLKLADDYTEMILSLRDLQQVTVCGINGETSSGGVELALACDLIFTTDKAQFNFHEVKYSFIKGGGLSKWLSKRLGASVAKECLFQNEGISGKDASKIGFSNKNSSVNPHGDEAFVQALACAKDIVNKAPLAIKMIKYGMNKLNTTETMEGLAIEEQLYKKIIPSNDRAEGIRAFRDKVDPRFKGN